MRSWVYDLAYRIWAPWDSVGVRSDLRALLETGRVSPTTHPRAADLGCGTGANVVHLAEAGYTVTGVDFSRVALQKARRRATSARVSCDFVEGDLTSPTLLNGTNSYDLVLDFGTLDDLPTDGRRAMADNIARLTRSGSIFLFWCFYADPATLPRFSFTGPSRAVPVILPGEECDLFGKHFLIEEFSRGDRTACFCLTRR
jgi:SAM-dependent methyltransferase